MKTQNIIILVSLVIAIASCKKQKPTPIENEENELITTVKLTFIDSLTHDTLTFKWTQPAGPGTLITVDTISLLINKTYTAKVEIFDESKTPVFDVTAEIKSLANEHRFYYSSTTTRLSTQITDFDTQSPPMELGLNFTAFTTSSGPPSGMFRTLLRHYTSSSPKTGGVLAGSADVDVSFPVRVD